jgi:hypothetical protein
MTEAPPSGLDTLPPDLRAVLSLVLARRRSYAEIAELLQIDRAAIQARAHLAADLLAADGTESLPADARSRIVDYLLGEQSVSERTRTRTLLTESSSEREWAAKLAAALAPLADAAVPSIPEGPIEQPRLADGRPDTQVAERHAPRPWQLLAALVVATAAGVAALLLITGTSANKRPLARPAAARSLPAVALPPRGAGAQTLRQVVLAPTAADRGALAVATIVRQGSGLVLALRAHGLRPNSGDAYAVWLENPPGDARLLGFVSPLVGADGSFSAGVRLPADAGRFHVLAVTRERGAGRPTRPGPTVVSGSLGGSGLTT